MFGPDTQNSTKIERRRELVFILFSGIFLGTLTMLNVLGLSKQLNFSFSIGSLHVPFVVFVGVLPYPITFLCTDFISEFYGRRRANRVVWVGLMLNVWVLFILWIGGVLPPKPELDTNALPDITHPTYPFYYIRKLTGMATAASMIAYLTAQFVDVQMFHLLKKLTKGKALWLRNNGSTLTSQLVDSVAVILITWLFSDAIHIQPGETVVHGLLILIFSNYIFKMVSALLDTIPFYLGVKYLSRYLQIDPNREFKDPKTGNSGQENV